MLLQRFDLAKVVDNGLVVLPVCLDKLLLSLMNGILQTFDLLYIAGEQAFSLSISPRNILLLLSQIDNFPFFHDQLFLSLPQNTLNPLIIDPRLLQLLPCRLFLMREVLDDLLQALNIALQLGVVRRNRELERIDRFGLLKLEDVGLSLR